MSDKNVACKDMVLELQNMTYLDWAVGKTMPGTPGCFVKVYEETECIISFRITTVIVAFLATNVSMN